jgi:methylamine---glutamate N-methyltransferase subunit C
MTPFAEGGVGRVRPPDHRLHSARRGHGPVRNSRARREAARAEFRRPVVPRRLAVALSARGVSRALRHQDRARHALRVARPIELGIPITIAGMSFGALSARVKDALGRAATEVGTSTTTGDGGMTSEERASSKLLVYQCLPSRYGFNPDDVRRADAIEIVIGQGAKPGGGGMLLGQKVNPRVAKHAHAAGGRRSALRFAPSGLDRPRRPGDQDQGAARDHRLGKADLRQGRRHARVQRREARGARGRGRHRRRRHAGRHRRHPDRVHRARRHSDAGGVAPGRRCARRSEHARHGAAGDLGWHPQRRRRRQGARDGRGCGCDRPGRAGGSWLQQRQLRCQWPASFGGRGLCASRHGARISVTIAIPANARSASRLRTRSSNCGSSPRSAPSASRII